MAGKQAFQKMADGANCSRGDGCGDDAKMMPLEDESVFERASSPPEVALGEQQLVLLDIAGAVYYTLEGPVAIRIWQLLAAPQSLVALVGTLVEEFEIDHARCREETIAYLQALSDKRLVHPLTPQ